MIPTTVFNISILEFILSEAEGSQYFHRHQIWHQFKSHCHSEVRGICQAAEQTDEHLQRRLADSSLYAQNDRNERTKVIK